MQKRILSFHSQHNLHPLSEVCFCLTPKVFLPQARDLYLDISVTEKRLGGEKAVLDKFLSLLDIFECEGQLVLCDRPELAKMFAHKEPVIVPPKKGMLWLARLPIETLLYCGDPLKTEEEQKERSHLIAFMKRIGMYYVGDFIKLNTQSVGRRFGALGISIKQWLNGEKNIYLELSQPQEKLIETIPADDIFHLESLLFAIRKALVKLETRLVARSQLAKSIYFSFELENGSTLKKELPLLEPQREATLLIKLVQELFRDLKWNSPLLRLEVEVPETILYHPGQLNLWDQTENKRQDVDVFVQRLQTRYGENSTGFAEIGQSHLPERSFQLVAQAKECFFQYPTPQRPLFFFSNPVPYFPPPQSQLKLSEKISSHWWENIGERHYFIVEDRQKKIWVYWDLKKQRWFIHGKFD